MKTFVVYERKTSPAPLTRFLNSDYINILRRSRVYILSGGLIYSNLTIKCLRSNMSKWVIAEICMYDFTIRFKVTVAQCFRRHCACHRIYGIHSNYCQSIGFLLTSC